MMHRLFLLRAFGDATIALHFLVNSPEKNNYTVIASSHLKPLISALSNYINIDSLKIEFIDIGINNSQLNVFTNRNLIATQTIAQINKLRAFLKANPNNWGVDYIEQKKRSTLLNVLTKYNFKVMVQDQVYEEMSDFFKSNIKFSDPTLPLGHAIHEILVLPDARIPARKIPKSVIEHIQKQSLLLNKTVRVAYFANDQATIQYSEGYTKYSSFDELLSLIYKADFIFGSDSLPIHLCNALQKPHYILYPKNGSDAFFTPFSRANQYYADFEKFTSLYFPI